MKRWKIADLIRECATGRTTIYRWMEKHPTLDIADPASPLGHPFPKPVGKEGREVLWDASEVSAWWSANSETVGREARNPTFLMPWTSYRKAMKDAKRVTKRDEKTGEEIVVSDDLEMVQRYERQGEQVRLWFRDVNDAVYFKLKYS